MKMATIYKRNNIIYMHGSSKTTAGLWIINETVIKLESLSDLDVGVSVQVCLESSVDGVDHPKTFYGLTDKLLNLAGVKSFNIFAKTARCVIVELEGKFSLIPTRNGGSSEGFIHLAPHRQLATISHEALGAAVLAALEVSR